MDDDREYMGQSNMSKENIINLIVKLQVLVQVRSGPVRSSQVHSGPVRSRSGPVRSSPVQVQSGPDLDLDLDKTQGPGLTLKSCRPPPPLPTTHPQLLNMKEGSHTKTQRVKLT